MDENPLLRKAVNLMSEASQLYGEKRQQEALQLIDEAIAIVEAAGLPPFQFRMAREQFRLGNSRDQSSFIPILEEAVDYHRREGNVLEQVDALIHLAVIRHRQQNPQALNYLDQASEVIEGLNPSQIDELNKRSPRGAFRTSTLLRLRLGEIARLRTLITGM